MCLLRGSSQTSWGKKNEVHRRHAQKLNIFSEIWNDDGDEGPPSQIPWQLTRDQIDLLELRMSRIMWPHYIERLYYRGASPWKKPGRAWKARRKYRLLWFLLPVQLRDRDMVPALREALVLMAWAIRRLQGMIILLLFLGCSYSPRPLHSPGQVYCFEAAVAMGILPGSPGLRRADIKKMSADLIRALVLLAGSVIITYLVPIFHHFVHYGEYTWTHGMLRLFWMMVFERYIMLLYIYIIHMNSLIMYYPSQV